MKRPKIKPPKPAPALLPLIEYGDRITQMIAETDSDPDYKGVFAEMLQEMN